MRVMNEQKAQEIQRLSVENNSKEDQNLGFKNQVRDLEARISSEWNHGYQLRNEIDRVRLAIEDSSWANHDASERIKINEFDLAQSRVREEDLKR